MDNRETFDILTSEQDGKPVVAIVVNSFRNYKNKSETPWCLWIDALIKNITGLPDNAEANELNEFENDLKGALSKAMKIHFVARTTWNGHRELFFYLDKVKEANEILTKIVNNSESKRHFMYEIVKDPKWDRMKNFLSQSK